MSDMKDRIDQLADMMEEYKLSEAEMAADGFRISFKKRAKPVVQNGTQTTTLEQGAEEVLPDEPPIAAVDLTPSGLPITSPMTGIYYNAPSPASPPFVKEGDVVSAGEVIGLIEAMKVFNEIPAPISGTVAKIMVETGQLVNLGDPLLYIG
ncbi:MAG: acetyl-CoA carboxylase biotin carboxyl carrier protein [Chlorobia bacterium]|nr:acetyl-CoA carboxylase biotin carboxyl carrier protein [Fimbriimonadaceae bacterium]